MNIAEARDLLQRLRATAEGVQSLCAGHHTTCPWGERGFEPKYAASLRREDDPFILCIPPLRHAGGSPFWAMRFDRDREKEESEWDFLWLIHLVTEFPPECKQHAELADSGLDEPRRIVLERMREAYRELGDAFHAVVSFVAAEERTLDPLESFEFIGCVPNRVRPDFYRACCDEGLRGEGLGWAYLHDMHGLHSFLPALTVSKDVGTGAPQTLRHYCEMIPYSNSESPRPESLVAAFERLPKWLFPARDYVGARWLWQVGRLYGHWLESSGRKGHAISLYEALSLEDLVPHDSYEQGDGPPDFLQQGREGDKASIESFRKVRGSPKLWDSFAPSVEGYGPTERWDWLHYRLAVLHAERSDWSEAQYHWLTLERKFRMGLVDSELYDCANADYLAVRPTREVQATDGVDRHVDWLISRVRDLEDSIRLGRQVEAIVTSEDALRGKMKKLDQEWSDKFNPGWRSLPRSARDELLVGRTLIATGVSGVAPAFIAIAWAKGVAVILRQVIRRALQASDQQTAFQLLPRLDGCTDMALLRFHEQAGPQPAPAMLRLGSLFTSSHGRLLEGVIRLRNKAAHGGFGVADLDELRSLTSDGEDLVQALTQIWAR